MTLRTLNRLRLSHRTFSLSPSRLFGHNGACKLCACLAVWRLEAIAAADVTGAHAGMLAGRRFQAATQSCSSSAVMGFRIGMQPPPPPCVPRAADGVTE